MNEKEWLECDDPGFMLDHIESKASDRKLRLFAVACCRRLSHMLTDERSRKAVEVTEQYADGLASAQTFQAAMEAACRVAEDDGSGEPTPATAACWIAYYPPFDAAYTCGTISVLMDHERMKDQSDWWATHQKEGEEEAKHQVHLARDIFGNPFDLIALDPSWLTGTVKALAQAIYTDRNFTDVPKLANALEEAGCNNEDILNHLRGPGEHTRGCWAVDLVLGKE